MILIANKIREANQDVLLGNWNYQGFQGIELYSYLREAEILPTVDLQFLSNAHIPLLPSVIFGRTLHE